MLHLDAGKYAIFLWPAYGLSVVVIAGLVIESLLRARYWRRSAEAFETKPDQSQDPS